MDHSSVHCRARTQVGPSHFASAWTPRKHEINNLKEEAREKTKRSQKIPVLQDTTLCKAYRMRGDAAELPALSASPTMLRAILEQLLRQFSYERDQTLESKENDDRLPAGSSWSNVKRILFVLFDCVGLPPTHHEEQLHVAEFVASKLPDIILNLDMQTSARNTAVVQASKSKSKGLNRRRRGRRGTKPGVPRRLWHRERGRRRERR